MTERISRSTDKAKSAANAAEATQEELETLSQHMALSAHAIERLSQYDLSPISMDLLTGTSVEQVSSAIVQIFQENPNLDNEMSGAYRVLPILEENSSAPQKHSAIMALLTGDYGFGIDRRMLVLLSEKLQEMKVDRQQI